MIFNPRHPVAVFKYDDNFWVTLLPGKYRREQGQVLHRSTIHDDIRAYKSTVFDSCQWSPGGQFLIVLQKFDSVDRPSDLNLGINFNVHLNCGIFELEKSRDLYRMSEIKNSWTLIPHCRGPHQLSSKL